MVTGKGIAYQAWKPLQGDIASDILNSEDQEFKHRAEKRLIEDRRAAAAAAKEKKRQDGLKRAKAIGLYDTESDTLNAVLAETVKMAQAEYPEIFKVLDDTSGRYSQSDQIKAQLKLDYLSSGKLVDDLKVMTNSVMDEYQEYQKGVASGQLFRDEDYEKKFENGYKGVTISLDENLRPVTIFKSSGLDQDGDGIIDSEDMESLNDVYSRPQFMKNFDYDGLVTKHASKLESAVNQTDSGFKKIKTTGVEPDLLEDTVERFLYNEDGSASEPMLAFLRQRGLDPNKPEDLETVEADYKNDVYLRTKRGKEEDFDASAFVSNKKEDRLSKEGQITLSEPVDPTKATWGSQYDNIDKNYNSVPVKGVKIAAIPISTGETITDADIVNYTYNKDGRMIVDVVYQDTKSETMTEEKYEKEIAEATKNNDVKKLFALQQASEISGGGKKVTLPGQKLKEQITISKENESKVANEMGMTIEEAKKKAAKPQQETDEYGVPIQN